MSFKIKVQDTTGVHEVEIDLAINKQAEAAGAKNVMAHIDNLVYAGEGQPTASQQIYHQMGFARKDAKLSQLMKPSSGVNGMEFASVADGEIAGRLVAQAYLMDTIEAALRSNDYGMLGLFNGKAAQVDSINGTKFDRPLIEFAEAEKGRSKAIAQLSEPASMALLTVSEKSYRIPGTAIGIEYSDQAAAQVSLPIVALSMTRQAETEAMERIEQQMLSFVNGDTDIDMPALAAVPGAVKNAKVDYDPSITVAGKLTQLAWVGWLFANSRKRRIDTVITDLRGALAIENREGRPTVQGDNATSKRIDTLESVINPSWPDKVEVFISQDPNWPTGTIVGFDSRYGYHIVNSTSLSYTASEAYAIRRSTKLRVDTGSLAYRLFDDAWAVLTLSV